MDSSRPEIQALIDEIIAWRYRPKSHRRGTPDDPRVQEIYAELMKTRWSPALRELGLKGSNGKYTLPSAKYWALIGFQRSAESDSDALKFTVNISLIDRELWDETRASKPYLGAKPTPTALYPLPHLHLRIGQLMPPGQDHWWILHRGQDPTAVADEVVEALRRYAVPWLIEHASR